MNEVAFKITDNIADNDPELLCVVQVRKPKGRYAAQIKLVNSHLEPRLPPHITPLLGGYEDRPH